ncbi:hypothetical protein EC930055_2212, partial [Escherichia coli 93.0055]
VIFARRSVSVS